MEISFQRRAYDLLAVTLLNLILVVLAMLATSGLPRVLLGMLSVLIFPGYVLVAALFPGNEEIEWLERIGLSLGLSLAILPLIGLLLVYTPWGITLESVLGGDLVFNLVFCAIAYIRRNRLPEETRLSIRVEIPPSSWHEYDGLEKAITLLLVAAIVIVGGALAYIQVNPGSGTPYTEFYILDQNSTTRNYPEHLNVNETGSVILGIVNHEIARVNYSVKVLLVTVKFVFNMSTGRNDTVAIANSTLDSFNVDLGIGESRERWINFTVLEPGDYELTFFLYKGPIQDDPYRTLLLLVRVE